MDGAGAEEADKVRGEDDEQHTVLKSGAIASAGAGIRAGTGITASVPAPAPSLLAASSSSRGRRRGGEEEASQGRQHATFFPQPAAQARESSAAWVSGRCACDIAHKSLPAAAFQATNLFPTSPAQPAHQSMHTHQLFSASDHSRRRWRNMRPIASWGEVKAVSGRNAQLTLHLKVNTCAGGSGSGGGSIWAGSS